MEKRPNFLLLLTDQQRYDTIHACGSAHMVTPHMDRLVEEGCMFPNAYSPNPLCMPARHCLLTGTTGRHHGYFGNENRPMLDDGLPTLPRVLSDNGYFTAAVGKMHFYPATRHHGFNQLHLMEEIPEHRDDDGYLQYLAAHGYGDIRNIHGVRPLVYHEPQIPLMPDEHHGENWVATQAIEVLERNKSRPFFLMCGWIKPHPPWNVSERWLKLYEDATLPEPIPVSREFPYYEKRDPWFGDDLPEERKRAERKAYYACVSMVDNAIGRITEWLERNDMLDNTFVILTSDHGEMLQDKGFHQKMLPYESSSRIPFVVRYPRKFRSGSRDERFVDLMDIFPTVIDTAGVDYNYKKTSQAYRLLGGSLLPEAKDGRDRDVQWVEAGGTGVNRWVFMRDGRYKYIYFYNGGAEQFYDLTEDPCEVRNLVTRGQVPDEPFARLKQRCVEFEAERGPAGFVKDGSFVKFDRMEPCPERDLCRYPLWANTQFQTFGDKPPAAEVSLFLDEIRKATSRHADVSFLAKVAPGPEWSKGFADNYRKLGATVGDVREICAAEGAEANPCLR